MINVHTLATGQTVLSWGPGNSFGAIIKPVSNGFLMILAKWNAGTEEWMPVDENDHGFVSAAFGVLISEVWAQARNPETVFSRN